MSIANEDQESSRRPARRALSIRVRLIILAAAALAPLAIERASDIQNDRRLSIEDARRQVLFTAQQGATRQNENVVAARAFLQMAAHGYAHFATDAEACNQFLAAVASSLVGIKTITTTGPDGRIDCAGNRSAIGLDVSDRPYVQQALRNGGFVLSDYTLGRRIQGPNVYAVYAERAPTGSVDRVFIAVLDLDWFGRAANDTAKRQGSVVWMIDGAGTILSRYPDTDEWSGKTFKDHPLVRTILDNRQGVVTDKDLDGVRRTYGFAQLAGTNTHFAVGFEESEVLRTANAAMWRASTQFGIVAVLVIAGIWFGGERFLLRPLNALTATATRFGHGQLTAQAMQEKLAAEFVPLATAMDDMAGRLAARESELRGANDTLKRLAQRDGLTGLANRYAFDAKLSDAWQDALDTAGPIALLMIDIDFFKRFNDRFGHLDGDECLRSVAGILSASARKRTDLAARFGGEEFALLLPGADLDEAAEVAERLRAAVAAHDVPISVAPGHAQVSISIGAACLIPTPESEPHDLIRAADEALYAAKHGGRNVVNLASRLRAAS